MNKLAPQRDRRSRGPSPRPRRDRQARERVVRDRPGLAPVLARIPARGPPAGDRRVHRRRACGLRPGLAAQGLAGGAHLLARRRSPIRPPRRRPGAAPGLRGLCAGPPPRRPDARSALRQCLGDCALRELRLPPVRRARPILCRRGEPPCATRRRSSPPTRAKPGTIRRSRAFGRCAAHRARAREAKTRGK